MTNVFAQSNCTRCGKRRIVLTTKISKQNGAVITYRKTVCPNPECQRFVQESLDREEIKRRVIKKDQEKRDAVRKQLRLHKNKNYKKN